MANSQPCAPRPIACPMHQAQIAPHVAATEGNGDDVIDLAVVRQQWHMADAAAAVLSR